MCRDSPGVIRSLTYLCLSLFLAKVATIKVVCERNWTVSNLTHRCLKTFPEEMLGYDQARVNCQRYGGDLVRINNTEENDYISNFVPQLGEGYWIGLHAEAGQDFWTWADEKEASEYLNWHEEPFYALVPSCAVINAADVPKGKWKSLTVCTTLANLVCEKDPDYICPDFTYGENCESTCSPFCGLPDRECEIPNGSCINPTCLAGYYGVKCDTPCQNRTYGLGCSQTCAECAGEEKACDNVKGHCLEGCEPGFQEPMCNSPCRERTYGTGCSQNCSENCGGEDRACDSSTGECLEDCQPGYLGLMCDATCPALTFGLDCASNCSENCLGGECSFTDGKCLRGCDGEYEMPMCDTIMVITKTSKKVTSSSFKLLVLLAVLVGAAVLSTILWIVLKRSRKENPVQDVDVVEGENNEETLPPAYTAIGPETPV